ncbi:hypothetical protein CVD28_24825 [Bacillus sp. M6-12]|uniref:hypothetical protein n=1 Tax=Bacillus sp. M6-12 TaxID=2054166 RepID=UPI000C783D62|nr:hypothetical protein [Bacillus sp. M6-12]PLS15071.1 hypothetical protein CVD28_24825 [Bacillus sp. M6-12]
MSRSYKKTPVVTDGHSGKEAKKFANRKVRRYKHELANGKAYRRVFNPYDIHDHISYYSYQSFKKDQEAHQKEVDNGVAKYSFYTDENDWQKCYRRK